jgi:Zn-dependent peptidase ImmA (M78 family)
MTLRRGFKAEAERRATDLRAKIGLSPAAPATSEQLARAADITIVDAATLIDVERLVELESIQAFAFSACTFEVRDRRIIVTNPLRSGGRRNSDVAHELSHVLLEHDLAEVRDVGGMFFRTCEPNEEEEATSLGGTLLLPRPLLLRAAGKGWGADEVADHYGVTTEMARYRRNTTGVHRQIAAARPRR